MSLRSLLSVPILLVLTSALSSPIQAQVQLDRLFPCVVQSGTTATIKAEGKFPTWPAKLVSDREDVQWATEDESGNIRVTVPEGTAPGVTWLRLTDDKSSSDLVPLLITGAPTLTETEPNQTSSEANQVKLPIAVCGKLGKSGDLDAYRLTAKSGESINVSLIANRILASPMDAVLQIADIQGNVLEQEDDSRGLDPSIRFVAPEDGDYLIRVFAFPETPNSTIGYAGAANFLYCLTIAQADRFVEHFLPLELAKSSEPGADTSAETLGAAAVNDSPNSAITPTESASNRVQSQPQPFGWQLPQDTSIKLTEATAVSPRVASANGLLGWQWIPEIDDQTMANVIEDSNVANETTTPSEPLISQKVPFCFSGHLSTQREVDVISFDVQAGVQYRLSVDSKRLGYPIDTELKVIDSKTRETIASNDDQSRNNYDSVVSFTAKEDGQCTAEIRDAVDGHGPHHAYTLKVQQVQPTFSLSVAAQRYTVEPGKTLEVTVSVTRENGFNLPVEISLSPISDPKINQMITAVPVTSEAKGDTAKAVKITLSATEDASYQGWIQIVGRSIEEDETNTATTAYATYSLRPEIDLKNLWLNVRPAK